MLRQQCLKTNVYTSDLQVHIYSKILITHNKILHSIYFTITTNKVELSDTSQFPEMFQITTLEN